MTSLEARHRISNQLKTLADRMANEAEQATWQRTRVPAEVRASASQLRYIARRALSDEEDLDVIAAYIEAATTTIGQLVGFRKFVQHLGLGGPL